MVRGPRRYTDILVCIALFGFIVAVIGASVHMYWQESHRPAPGAEKQPPTVPATEPSVNIPNPYIKGPKDAKVRIEAYIPMDIACHMITVGLLYAIAEAEPKRVRVEIYNMNSDIGQERMEQKGIICAAVFINGESEHKVVRNGELTNVHLGGPINEAGGGYTVEDVIYIVNRELKQAYGKGFDSKVLAELKKKWSDVTGEEAAAMVSDMLGKKVKVSKGKAPTTEFTPDIPVAKPTSKIVVEFYRPPEGTPGAYGFDEAINHVRKLQMQYPDRITLEIYDMLGEQATNAVDEGRIPGPCVLVNGHYEHVVVKGGERQVIKLDVQPMAGKFLKPDNVVTVIKAYLGKETNGEAVSKEQ